MSEPTPEEIARLQEMPEFKGREAYRPGPLRDAALSALRSTPPRCPNCGNGYLFGESLDHDCWRTLAQHLGVANPVPDLRLAASAPALFEALKKALVYLEGDDPNVTSGGHKNVDLREIIKSALSTAQPEAPTE